MSPRGTWPHTLILALVVAAWATAGRAQSPPPGPASDATPEVVVTGGRGLAPREVPLEQLSDVEVGAFGADSARDLLDQLKPRTASSMSSQEPIVLVDGRVAGTTELENLPPEAILRVDILPERSALRYGFDDSQRVVNLILRERYRGGATGVSDRAATEGGGQSVAADAVATRVEQEGESTLRIDHRQSERLLESARGIDSPDSDLRTLLPQTSETKIGATLVRPVLSLRPSLEASVDLKSSDSLQGEGTPDPASGALAPLTQHIGTTVVHVAARVSAPLGRFVGSLSATGDETRGQQHVDAGGAPQDRSTYTLDTGRMDASLGGPLVRLPAGAVVVNVYLDAQLDRIRAQEGSPGQVSGSTHLSRATETARARARIPLTSRDLGVLPVAGDLAARFSAGVDEVSQLGTLASYSYGLTWSPLERVYLNADLSDARLAPGIQDLRAPPQLTPGVQTFDFVTGETGYVTQVSGGNPQLRPTDRRSLRLGLYLGTFGGESSVYANYERRRDHDAVGTLPPVTAAVQAAFPGRFIRDGSGTLVEVDARAVNLARQARDVMSWGINLGLPFAAGGPHASDLHLMLSLQDTWYFHDTVQVADGLPGLDLLDGAPLGAAAGTVAGVQPRHLLQLWATLRCHALGAQLTGRWTSAAHLDAGMAALPGTLRFSALGTAGLRVFTDMDRLLRSSAGSWAKGMRVSLGISNLLGARGRVVDGTGATPAGFAPGYLDPLGRAVTVSLRKAL